jgi:hypothetical protein
LFYCLHFSFPFVLITVCKFIFLRHSNSFVVSVSLFCLSLFFDVQGSLSSHSISIC